MNPIYHYVHNPFRTDAEKLDQASEDLMTFVDDSYRLEDPPLELHEHSLDCVPGCKVSTEEIDDEQWGM